MFERSVAHHLTPVGWLTLRANHIGLTAVEFGRNDAPFALSDILESACKELDQYFQGELNEFSVPVIFTGTPFQKMVWECLKRIPYGAIPSYSDIAEEIGRPSCVRAVGSACNLNPLPIVIPCHRVISKDGSLAGYAGGLNLKRKLLDLELRVASGRIVTSIQYRRPAQLELIQ